MRTLVVSDLHLGSRARRDVLQLASVRERLVEAVREADRLVLLGDTVELLEGRPKTAMRLALPILRELGGATDHVVLVAGNHDRRLVAPWLRRAERLTPAARVPVSSSEELRTVADALSGGRRGKVEARYPGVWLAPRVFGHHGHYVDRQLLPRSPRGLRVSAKDGKLTVADYERVTGPPTATLDALLRAIPQPVSDAVDAAVGAVRAASFGAAPRLDALLPSPVLAPMTAGALGMQFRRSGLPAMAAVVERLALRADHVVFGHLHRAGPLGGDDPSEWRPQPDGPRLWNCGSWVYEPLLLAGARPPHAYWPGSAIAIDHDHTGTTLRQLRLLDDLTAREFGDAAQSR